MRSDHALSHLTDGEICKATVDHEVRDLRWSRTEWRFYFADTPDPAACDFDDIEEWWIGSIKDHPKGKLT